MPPLRDLTKCPPFGRLTPRKVNAERTAETGNVWWDCDCRCGGTKTVRAICLTKGFTRSCGCLVRRQSPRNGFKKRAALQAHKDRYVVRHGGKLYYSRRAAARYLGVTYQTVLRWADPAEGCPWLGGQVIVSIPLPTAYDREVRYYLERDLARVRKAQSAVTKAAPIPTYPGLVWLGDACRDVGVTTKTLKKLLARLTPPVALVEKVTLAANGQTAPRPYVPVEAVKAIKGRRAATAPPPDRMTVVEAMAALQVSKSSIHNLAEKWGLDLRREPAPVTVAGGRRGGKPAFVTVSRAAVEALRRERAGRTTGPAAEAMPGAASHGSAQRDRGRQPLSVTADLDEQPCYGNVGIHSFTPRAQEELRAIIKALLDASRADDDGYITGKQACALTGFSPAEMTRVCREGGAVRFKRPQPRRLLVHAADLARYIEARDAGGDAH